MRFCATMVQDRKIKPRTMATYFSQVQGWHARQTGVKLCAGLKLNRLPEMLKGLVRILGETPQWVRRGIAPQALRRAFDLLLDPLNAKDANIRASSSLGTPGVVSTKQSPISIANPSALPKGL